RRPAPFPPSVPLEPRPDANMAVTLSGTGPLIRSELWLKACPDAGVQTALGAGPFGMTKVTESSGAVLPLVDLFMPDEDALAASIKEALASKGLSLEKGLSLPRGES